MPTIVSVELGGTGANNIAEARAALGVPSSTESNAAFAAANSAANTVAISQNSSSTLFAKQLNFVNTSNATIIVTDSGNGNANVEIEVIGGSPSQNVFESVNANGTLITASSNDSILSIEVGTGIDISANAATSTFNISVDKESLGISSNSNSSNSTSEVIVDSFNKNTYLSAKYIIQVKSTTNPDDVQTSEVLLVHNGSSTFSTEYAIVEISNTIATISSDIDGELVRLKVTPLISGTEMKTFRLSIEA